MTHNIWLILYDLYHIAFKIAIFYLKTCTGDVHNAVYDLTLNDMYVAVASPHGADSKTKQAYKNSYVKFDMDDIFSVKKPEL